jgi:phenylalanyl-tRNA synthetase beta chain
MNLSRSWLEAFLGRSLDAADVAHRLAMRAAPTDEITDLHAALEPIVVGRVEEARTHPNADRLTVCLVDDGSGETRHVVCGAPNVKTGGYYPFIRVGDELPGGMRIEQRKIRGEVSQGMLCSARELELGDDHDGILELEGTPTPGSSFRDLLGLRDQRLLLDVTPNRGDLLSHKGVARELAASHGVPFRLPALPGTIEEPPAIHRVDSASGYTGDLEVRIDDLDGCGRFLGAVVRGVKVGPSPHWLRQRMESVGLRSISNVVDATNYVMMELGQPLHAYDLGTLRGNLVTARAARAGESVETLDGVHRKIAADMLVIADGEGVVGVAGVMGGKATEVGPETVDLFLECAWFAPTRVRAARKALAIPSEASHRFERGVDKWNGPEALRRCLEVILRSAGGRVEYPPVDVWPGQEHPPRIFLRQARVAQVLGLDLPLQTIEKALVAIGATVVSKPDDHRLAVEVPGWRTDLIEEIDLVEEVARQYGYENIPSDLRPYRRSTLPDSRASIAERRVRRGLVGQGLLEVVTLPFEPTDPGATVEVQNPLSGDHRFLRRDLLPGLIREVERNWAAQTRDIRLFEIGTVFLPGEPGARPTEQIRVAVAITGARAPAHWTTGAKAEDLDQWDLKGLFEQALSLANRGAVLQVEDGGGGWYAEAPDGIVVGRAGVLSADAPRWAAGLFGFEVEVTPAEDAPMIFVPYATTPKAERDLALVVPDELTAAEILRVVTAEAGPLLESTSVVDEYRGTGIPEGARSLAVRLVFRSPERTLRDEEVDSVVRKICSTLAQEHHVVLRAS